MIHIHFFARAADAPMGSGHASPRGTAMRASVDRLWRQAAVRRRPSLDGIVDGADVG